MKEFGIISVLTILFHLGTCAPRHQRWIPERYSDYGMDGSNSDGNSGGNNFLSYFWPEYFQQSNSDTGDYAGLYYRAGSGGDNRGQMMTDPVQMLQNVQTLAYAQHLQQQYPQMFQYGQAPGGRSHSAHSSGHHEGVDGRALLDLGSLDLLGHPQTQQQLVFQPNRQVVFMQPQQSLAIQQSRPFFIAQPNPQTSAFTPNNQVLAIRPGSQVLRPVTNSETFEVVSLAEQTNQPVSVVEILSPSKSESVVELVSVERSQPAAESAASVVELASVAEPVSVVQLVSVAKPVSVVELDSLSKSESTDQHINVVHLEENQSQGHDNQHASQVKKSTSAGQQASESDSNAAKEKETVVTVTKTITETEQDAKTKKLLEAHQPNFRTSAKLDDQPTEDEAETEHEEIVEAEGRASSYDMEKPTEYTNYDESYPGVMTPTYNRPKPSVPYYPPPPYSNPAAYGLPSAIQPYALPYPIPGYEDMYHRYAPSPYAPYSIPTAPASNPMSSQRGTRHVFASTPMVSYAPKFEPTPIFG